MKKLRKAFSIFTLIVILSLVGCSASSKEESSKLNNKNNPEMDSAASSEKQVSLSSGKQEKANIATENTSIEVPNQMVIYQADLQLRIKNFDQTVRNLEGKAEHYGGYVAESSVSKEGAEQVSGNLTIRIPQQHFQDFLHDAEGQALVVLQRNITGQDVTEEYVDLDSRIKSKRVVEERLLSFMKGATKTEDLLKISADLATVQEEIEIITGRMKFLVNQTALSTVNIGLYENKVIIPKIDQDKLNTWEKTKKQFMKSINMLLAALSGFIVFIVGNLPILSVLIVLAVLGYFFYKKRKNRKDRD